MKENGSSHRGRGKRIARVSAEVAGAAGLVAVKLLGVDAGAASAVPVTPDATSTMNSAVTAVNSTRAEAPVAPAPVASRVETVSAPVVTRAVAEAPVVSAPVVTRTEPAPVASRVETVSAPVVTRAVEAAPVVEAPVVVKATPVEAPVAVKAAPVAEAPVVSAPVVTRTEAAPEAPAPVVTKAAEPEAPAPVKKVVAEPVAEAPVVTKAKAVEPEVVSAPMQNLKEKTLGDLATRGEAIHQEVTNNPTVPKDVKDKVDQTLIGVYDTTKATLDKVLPDQNNNGYDHDGYNKDGYDKDGYNHYGVNKDGYDKDGKLCVPPPPPPPEYCPPVVPPPVIVPPYYPPVDVLPPVYVPPTHDVIVIPPPPVTIINKVDVVTQVEVKVEQTQIVEIPAPVVERVVYVPAPEAPAPVYTPVREVIYTAPVVYTAPVRTYSAPAAEVAEDVPTLARTGTNSADLAKKGLLSMAAGIAISGLELATRKRGKNKLRKATISA